MSVGHVSRAFEEAGIPNVVIASAVFEAKLVPMSLPRLVLTDNIMGRPMGYPGEIQKQTEVLVKALELLDSATENGIVVNLAGR